MKKSVFLSVLIAGGITFTPSQSSAQECMLGEVKLFAGNFAPRGWMKCEGQTLTIAKNSALFSIIGVTYGGDGRVTFAVPDLRGRTAVGAGAGLGTHAVTQGKKLFTASKGEDGGAALGLNYIICVNGSYPSRQ